MGEAGGLIGLRDESFSQLTCFRPCSVLLRTKRIAENWRGDLDIVRFFLKPIWLKRSEEDLIPPTPAGYHVALLRLFSCKRVFACLTDHPIYYLTHMSNVTTFHNISVINQTHKVTN